MLSCINTPEQPVHARYWLTPLNSNDPLPEGAEPDSQPYQHPEKFTPAVWVDLSKKADLGLCFSGGGTRAASAAVGQLRALHALGILPRVRYISAVSGGSWATTPYTYIAADRISAFLEEYVAPGDLGKPRHMQPGSGSLTRAISEAYVTARSIRYLFKRRGSEAYSRTISDRFLDPFDLGGSNRWFTWNEATATEVRNRNPRIGSSVRVVPPGRPFLIVNGTIRNYDCIPFVWKDRDPEKRIPIEFTPLYSGVRVFHPGGDYHKLPIGGGFVESFAYDTISPEISTAQGIPDGQKWVKAFLYRRWPWQGEAMLTLADIMGCSGAAPGEFALGTEFLGLPKLHHWSPRELGNTETDQGARYSHSDGGQSDNLGLLPLLARGVKNIIAFVNAKDAAVMSTDVNVTLPDYVNCFFEEQSEGMFVGCKVFNSAAKKAFGVGLRASIEDGGPAVVAMNELKVLCNPRWGITGYTVNIVWVFLEGELTDSGKMASRNWTKMIPKEGAAGVLFAEKNRLVGSFPMYSTGLENKGFRFWDVIRLDPVQTTLLAHYAAWTVMQSEKEIQGLMKK